MPTPEPTYQLRASDPWAVEVLRECAAQAARDGDAERANDLMERVRDFEAYSAS